MGKGLKGIAGAGVAGLALVGSFFGGYQIGRRGNERSGIQIVATGNERSESQKATNRKEFSVIQMNRINCAFVSDYSGDESAPKFNFFGARVYLDGRDRPDGLILLDARPIRGINFGKNRLTRHDLYSMAIQGNAPIDFFVTEELASLIKGNKQVRAEVSGYTSLKYTVVKDPDGIKAIIDERFEHFLKLHPDPKLTGSYYYSGKVHTLFK